MTETRKSMADWFRRAERAAEEEERDAERQRLEAGLADVKRKSVEAFDARAKILGQQPAAETRITEITNTISELEEELEAAKKERHALGMRGSGQSKAGKDLAREGRRLEEALGVDPEEQVFGQHGPYSGWPNSGHTRRQDAGLPEEYEEEEV